jgi:hypothetical protein
MTNVLDDQAELGRRSVAGPHRPQRGLKLEVEGPICINRKQRVCEEEKIRLFLEFQRERRDRRI